VDVLAEVERGHARRGGIRRGGSSQSTELTTSRRDSVKPSGFGQDRTALVRCVADRPVNRGSFVKANPKMDASLQTTRCACAESRHSRAAPHQRSVEGAVLIVDYGGDGRVGNWRARMLPQVARW
jgi:hypothetical protein